MRPEAARTLVTKEQAEAFAVELGALCEKHRVHLDVDWNGAICIYRARTLQYWRPRLDPEDGWVLEEVT